MKKYFIACCCAAVFAACGGTEEKKTGEDTEPTKEEAKPAADAGDVTTNPDYVKGLELIGKSDCLTCHEPLAKKIGPAYSEVADKYAGQDTAVAYLSKKIIAGGSGVWGTVPMTPHATLSQADAEQMAKYVLLLKTK
ncbi:c-type cytochrome [Foetidibacter luteolus]|uniref:c-type cytochrome n=1 Tax=Foetidibacter luteolus TaxID=2608880 RepID=UPI001F413743|nr:c-type cytochrome [Foetidibacter luteolus]